MGPILDHIPSGASFMVAFQKTVKAPACCCSAFGSSEAPRRDRSYRQISLDADGQTERPDLRTGRLKATRHDARPDPTHVARLGRWLATKNYRVSVT